MLANTLFSSGSLTDWLQAKLDDAIRKVRSVSDEHILGAETADLVTELTMPHLIEPVVLQKNNIEIQDKGLGDVVTIAVPFRGDASILQLVPPTFSHDPPRGCVVDDSIALDYANPQEAKQHIKADIAHIEKWLANGRDQIERHNDQLPGLILPEVQKLKDAITAHRARLQELKESLEAESDADAD